MKKQIKRICALFLCGLIILLAMLPFSMGKTYANGKLEVGYWILKETRLLYAGNNRSYDDEVVNLGYYDDNGNWIEKTVPYREYPNDTLYYVKDRVFTANHVANLEAFDTTFDIAHRDYNWVNYIRYAKADISWGDPPSVIHVYSNNGPETSEREDMEVSVPITVNFDVEQFLWDYYYRMRK